MSVFIKPITQTVTSANGSDTAGTAIRIAGQPFEVQMFGPAAFHEVQVSMDGHNWQIATDAGGTNITALAASYRTVREQPMWARPRALNDSSGPRDFPFVFNVLVLE